MVAKDWKWCPSTKWIKRSKRTLQSNVIRCMYFLYIILIQIHYSLLLSSVLYQYFNSYFIYICITYTFFIFTFLVRHMFASCGKHESREQTFKYERQNERDDRKEYELWFSRNNDKSKRFLQIFFRPTTNYVGCKYISKICNKICKYIYIEIFIKIINIEILITWNYSFLGCKYSSNKYRNVIF